jgi:Catalase
MSDERLVTTTDAGIPAASDEFSLTAGPVGPTVLHDHYVVQKMQHFDRERVPERVVHAKGSGAHGFFEVTEDVTQWTKASFLATAGSARRSSRACPPSQASWAAPTPGVTPAASRSSCTPRSPCCQVRRRLAGRWREQLA